VIVLDSPSNALVELIPFAPAILMFLEGRPERGLYIIQRDFKVIRFNPPNT
jgi:hypothetical protein